MKNINPTQTTAWKKLEKHFSDVQQLQLKEQFEKDPERAAKFSIAWEDFYVDYSKNRITADTRDLLLELAEECDLKSAIDSYFKGDAINATENRAVLHTALRAPADAEIKLDGQNIVPEVQEVKEKIRKFSDKIISG
ncbi:MAG: glucose-6-phosphate isomerase, partial [Salegentibacter mishustinae]|nr:glucose-6-phosphate isomerase [Salegentibacter mishustinae]